jgi:hypothetical protein
MPRPMLYGSHLHGYTPYAQGLRLSLIEWIIQRMNRKSEISQPFYRIQTNE